MRPAVYAVAILAAAGIMYFIATGPDAANEGEQDMNAEVARDQESASNSMDLSSVSVVKMRVPNMACADVCFPAIKEYLEKSDTVVSVELTEQKEADTIDNPEILVSYVQGFDFDDAIESLDRLGFSDTTVVEPSDSE